MNIKLKIWRQKNANAKGKFENYTLEDVSPEMSFLEMMDALNMKLIIQGDEPVALENDCRSHMNHRGQGLYKRYIVHMQGPKPSCLTLQGQETIVHD